MGVDTDQKPLSVESDLASHCLLRPVWPNTNEVFLVF